MWDEPDAQRDAPHRLDPGLQVQMVQQWGTWARVVCHNEFAGWVQSAQLTPLGVAATRARPSSGVAAVGSVRRPWVIASVVAGLLVIGGGIWLATAGDDGDRDASTDASASTIESTDLDSTDPDSTDADETTVSALVGTDVPPTTAEGPATPAAAVELNVPQGWTLSADGLVAAEDPADLVAATPSGPVVRAEVGAPDDADLEAMLQDAVAGAAEAFVLAGPDETIVDGYDALVLTVREAGRSKSLVMVDPVGAESVLFTLDAPVERADELNALLASVPGFAVSGPS